MGCGSSAATSTTPEGQLAPRPSSAPTKVQMAKTAIANVLKPGSAGSRKPHSADSTKGGGKVDETLTASTTTTTNGDARFGSANSGKSVDSGIGIGDPNDPLINRNPLKPVDNDDTLPRLDEQKVIESLRAEGLLTAKTNTTHKGGLTFEVPLGELKVPSRRPPARLKKLQRTEQMAFSKEMIREKLAKAERLRKQREQSKLQRNREKDTRNLDMKLALLKIEKAKEKLEEPPISKKTDEQTKLPPLVPTPPEKLPPLVHPIATNNLEAVQENAAPRL